MISKSINESLSRTAGPLDQTNADKVLADVRRRVGEIRTDIRHNVEEKHSSEIPKWITSAEKISKNVKHEAVEIDAESDRVKKLLTDWTKAWNADNVKTMHKDLAAADKKMKTLRPLAELHESLELLDATEQRQRRDYTKRAGLIVTLDGSIRSLLETAAIEKAKRESADGSEEKPGEFHLQMPMLKALRDELILRKESLTFDLYEDWGEIFRWDRDSTNRFILNVGSRLDDIVAALKMLNLLEKKMDHLGKCLVNYLLIPALKESGSKLRVVVPKNESKAEIVLTKSTGDQEKTQFSVDFLDDCFSVFQLLKEKLTSPPQFAQQLTEGYILNPLKEFIVESVLKPAVPADTTDAPGFDRLLAACDGFLQKLKSIGLISDKESSFSQFAANVDGLFLAKRCQTILDQANRLITADLHNTVQVGGDAKPADDAAALAKCLEKIKSQKKERQEKESTPLRLELEKPLPPLREFPKCRVSEAVVSLLELIMKTLTESSKSPKPLAAARLYHCTRNMVEMYLDLVPVRHEHQLKMVPQSTAVFYNNCYFLCHHLMTLGSMFEAKLVPAFGVPSGTITITFIDFIPRLKELATDYMDAQVQTQTRYLIDCVKPAEGFRNISNKVAGAACGKALKASILQLQHINRVWRQVFAPAVLLKYQGKLGDELLKHIVNAVVRLEDIAADDAKVMHEMFSSLLTDIEACFMIDNISYAHHYCETGYYKFKELLFVLNASLVEIEDRWAAGGGPLAEWMDPLDVKQLIRALFQNTDKRAALISKIK